MEKEKRLIDANALSNEVDKSKHNNPHPPGMVRVNHRNEHDHFVRMIYDAPTVDAIVPPVKIGQVLWCNIPHSKFPLECRVYCICQEERNGLVLDYFRCVVKGWFGKAFCFEDVGKTVFLTEEEALAKMDGGHEDG